MQDKMQNIQKWNTIFKLVKHSNSTADLYRGCDWICTDYAQSLISEKQILVMHPLQTHPYGKDFGCAPTGLSGYSVTESQLNEFFQIQEGRSYVDEQSKYEPN